MTDSIEELIDRRGRNSAWIAAVTGVIAGYLLWFAPDTIGGIPTGIAGSALMLLCVWSVVHHLSVPRSPSGAVGLGEKEAWIDLALTLVIGAYLVSKLAALGWQIDIQTRGGQQIGINIAVMIVGAALLTQRLRHREEGMTLEDERDQAIRQRAGARGHSFLVVAIVVLIVTLALNPEGRLAFASPDGMAHLLIGALLLAEVFRHASAIRYYRQDRA